MAKRASLSKLPLSCTTPLAPEDKQQRGPPHHHHHHHYLLLRTSSNNPPIMFANPAHIIPALHSNSTSSTSRTVPRARTCNLQAIRSCSSHSGTQCTTSSMDINPVGPNGVLHKLATILFNTFVRDFLLSASSSTPSHLQQLRNPDIFSRSAVFTCEKTIIENSVHHQTLAQSNRTRTFTYAGTKSYLPLVAADNIFLGIGACNGTTLLPAKDISNSPSPISEWVPFRFVFDSNTRTLLLVYHTDDHLFTVSTLTAKSATASEYGAAAFSQPSFRNLIEKENVSISDLYSASTLVEDVLLPHACRICQTETGCPCTLKLTQPAHRHDYNSFISNLALFSFAAASTGTRVKVKYNGVTAERKRLISRYNISLGQVTDNRALEEVRALSIRKLLMRRRERPRESQSLLVTAESDSAGEVEVATSSGVDVVSQPRSALENPLHFAFNDFMDLDSIYSATNEQPSSQVDDLLFFPTNPDFEQLEFGAPQTVPSSEEESRGPETSAPTPTIEENTPAAIGESDRTATPIDFANMTREERRRERNRQSARRSHKRHAEHRKRVETELQALKVREQALRRRDHQLRMENLELRRQVSRILSGQVYVQIPGQPFISEGGLDETKKQ